MQEDSSERCASLSASSNSREDCALEGEFKVGIWHDDGCIVATKLKDGLSEAAMDISTDSTTHSGGAGEGDKGDTGILNHGSTDVGTVTGDDSHNTVEAIGLENISDHFAKGDSDERCGLSSLPDDLVTTDHGEAGVPAADSNWEVECCDNANVTDGVPDLHHEVTGTLRVEHLAINGS